MSVFPRKALRSADDDEVWGDGHGGREAIHSSRNESGQSLESERRNSEDNKLDIKAMLCLGFVEMHGYVASDWKIQVDGGLWMVTSYPSLRR